MKLFRFFITLILLAILLLGCTAAQNVKDGIYTNEQLISGGHAEAAENINVKDIDIIADKDQTVITLSMLSGSRQAGYPESKLTKLPQYEISLLDQPQRLMIKLHHISFWDYQPKLVWALSDFVLGVFREVPADDDTLIIYIQLSKSADFLVEESEGDLVVRLAPANDNAYTQYYCISDSFYEHQEGTWPKSIEMSPVLCADLENKLLISRPFATKKEADAFMETARGLLKESLPNNALYVLQIAGSALPDYSIGIDYSGTEGKSVVMKHGILIETPLLLQNGRYLATAPDGRIAFSRSYKPEEPALEQDSYLLSDKLWILDPNGRIQSVNVSDFYSIYDASFSPDGRYICIRDVSMENRVLYVYDFDSKQLINLGEEGFGNQTAAFVWSDKENILYAMTGYGSMQMMACTFLPDGTISIDAIEEEAGSEGKLAISGGRLFFADNFAGFTGKIYEITNLRREITQGVDFIISPDGKTMLVLEVSSSEEEEVLTSLKLCDIQTGKASYIVQNANINNFCFSQNGGKVYYTDELIDNPAGEYKFGLFSYDIVSAAPPQQVALCNTGEFVPSSTTGQLYFISKDTGNIYYATYIYDLNKK
ncbi:MAG: hypothetical protein ACOX8Q_06175 [Christensenellales bacterium]